TIHLEGIWAHGDGLVEGVQMYAPQATLQLENDRFDHLHTKAGGYHSDLVQWGAGRRLRVDRFTGSSEVQGISSFGARGVFDLRQVDIRGLAGSSDPSPVLLWLGMTSATLENVYVQPRRGEALGSTLDPLGGVAVGRNSIEWPGSRVRGRVRRGNPSSGE